MPVARNLKRLPVPSRLFRAIRDRKENLAAFRLLTKSLKSGAKPFPDHLIDWRPRSCRRTVYWLEKNRIWAALEASKPGDQESSTRCFWAFGIDNPDQQESLRITVEINPPHEGETRRLAGLFARDEKNCIYLAHDGKVGGGSAGVGLNEFRKFLRDDAWQEIRTQDGRRMAIIFGPMNAPDFPDQLAKFVRNVARFKDAVRRSRNRR